jgi:hypothetical protein
MPWYEGRRCQDCGYEWDDIDVAESLTVGTIDDEQDEDFSLYSCPGCYLTLRVQRLWDGNSWRHWCRKLPRTRDDPSGRLVAQVVNRISALLAARRTIYQPLVVLDLGRIDCPLCENPLVLGPVDRPPPDCPKCHSRRTVGTGAGGIVTLHVESSPEDRAGGAGWDNRVRAATRDHWGTRA